MEGGEKEEEKAISVGSLCDVYSRTELCVCCLVERRKSIVIVVQDLFFSFFTHSVRHSLSFLSRQSHSFTKSALKRDFFCSLLKTVGCCCCFPEGMTATVHIYTG